MINYQNIYPFGCIESALHSGDEMWKY